MPTIKQLPTHQRPREKLLEKGAAALNDEELLAIILRTGMGGKSALQIAKQFLKDNQLVTLPNQSRDKIILPKGLGAAKLTQILAALELGKRALQTDQTQPALNNPEAVISLLNGLGSKPKEHFVALYLNARYFLLHQETVSIGHLTASLVHPREVFKPAFQHSAAYIIIAHNHPSNDATPSDDDLALTNRLVEAGILLDIHILDHLIIARDHWISLKQLGLHFG